MTGRVWRAAFVLIAVLGLPALAAAHALAPSLLDLRVGADGQGTARFKTPSLRPTGTEISPVFPPACAQVGDPGVSEEGTGTVFEFTLSCEASALIGQVVGFGGLGDSRTNGLVRVELPDGHVVRRVVDASQPTLVIPRAPTAWQTAGEYVALGFGHILGGIDHLLFVAGLMLLVRGVRMLVETITAFTIGHSITLSAAALGLARVPERPVEVAIAASIVWLALEIARERERPERRGWRRPRSLAAGFGLLHGFGFAGALAEVGLPPGDIPLALGSFNVGIELGQLTFVAALVAIVAALRPLRVPLPAWGTTAAAYAIGSLASFWMFERLALALI